jgi:hypothetical protein
MLALTTGRGGSPNNYSSAQNRHAGEGHALLDIGAYAPAIRRDPGS